LLFDRAASHGKARIAAKESYAQTNDNAVSAQQHLLKMRVPQFIEAASSVAPLLDEEVKQLKGENGLTQL